MQKPNGELASSLVHPTSLSSSPSSWARFLLSVQSTFKVPKLNSVSPKAARLFVQPLLHSPAQRHSVLRQMLRWNLEEKNITLIWKSSTSLGLFSHFLSARPPLLRSAHPCICIIYVIRFQLMGIYQSLFPIRCTQIKRFNLL